MCILKLKEGYLEDKYIEKAKKCGKKNTDNTTPYRSTKLA